MTDTNGQPFKTSPAMWSSSRRASAASQGRRRSSANSRRASISAFNIDDFNLFDQAPYLTMDQYGNINLDEWNNEDYGMNDSAQQQSYGSVFENGVSGFEGYDVNAYPLYGSVRRSSRNMSFSNPRVSLPTGYSRPLNFQYPPLDQPQQAYYPQGYYFDPPAYHDTADVDAYVPLDSNIDPRLLGNGPTLYELPSWENRHQQLGPDDHSYEDNPQASAQLVPGRKRKRTWSTSGSTAPFEPENSEGPTKNPRTHNIPARSTRSSSSGYVSNHTKSSTDVYKNPLRRTTAIAYEPGEKPNECPDKAWVRTNGCTLGLTTRTAKINQYEPPYELREKPLDNWTSYSSKGEKKNEWMYTDKGEFGKKTYTAGELKDFIRNYPNDPANGIKLRLWIQKAPTDSARRYWTPSHSKCRFDKCPAHQYQTGTILHGHYRVAFDEMYTKHRGNYDPFHVTGYVHLYCMERFLNFPEICRSGIVEIDSRVLHGEPRGKFAAGLNMQPESHIGRDFVAACLQGGLRKLRKSIPEFKNYPDHDNYRDGEPKPHKDTLTYAMTRVKAEHRPPAQQRQFEARDLRPSHLWVNMGDLEMLFSEQKLMKQKKGPTKKHQGKKAMPADKLEEILDDETRAVLQDAKKRLKTSGVKKRKRSPPKRLALEAAKEDDNEEEHEEPNLGDDEDDDPSEEFRESTSQGSRLSQRLKDMPKKDYSQGLASPVNTKHRLAPKRRRVCSQDDVIKVLGNVKHTSTAPEVVAPEGYLPAVPFGESLELPNLDSEQFEEPPPLDYDELGNPIFPFDQKDQDLRDFLSRRGSSFSRAVRLGSQSSSFLKSALSSRRASELSSNCRVSQLSAPRASVSFFGAEIREFDKDAIIIPRRTSLRRAAAPKSPIHSPVSPKYNARVHKYG